MDNDSDSKRRFFYDLNDKGFKSPIMRRTENSSNDRESVECGVESEAYVYSFTRSVTDHRLPVDLDVSFRY